MANRQHLERKQKPCEHRLGGVAHVPAVLELAEVLRQMLGGDMNVSALDAVLKPRPKSFDGVDVMDTVNPLIGGMVDGAVVVTEPRNFGVRRKLVGADGRAISRCDRRAAKV